MTDSDLTESVKELIQLYKDEIDAKDVELSLLSAKVRKLENHLLDSGELRPLPETDPLMVL